ncbi:MAG: hypothetical protein OXI43_21575 [Candidatus Poribacteria bacterium]|nr:hypothetical protein [Candidatus Poribacteria bacterium]
MNHNDYYKYVLTDIELTRDEFDNLIFMGPPPIWKKYPSQHRLLLGMCFKTIKEVVEIITNGKNLHSTSSVDVFQNLQKIVAKQPSGQDESDPWFRKHLILTKKFDETLMDPIWIRNPSIHGEEKQYCGKDQRHFYMQDGNHRALVYAIRVACGEEDYKPVKAVHATSWKFAEGILRYIIQEHTALEHDGRLHPENQDYVTGFGASIEIYKRIE